MRRFDEDQTTQTLPRNMTRRRLLQAAGLGVMGTAVYSCEFSRHAIEHIALPVAIRNLPGTFHGFRIVQISDIHFDNFTEPFFLDRIIREVNALSPDLLLMTGDFITHGLGRHMPERSIHVIAEALNGLTCPQRLACMGNHDSEVGAAYIAGVLRAHGTPVLINQHVAIDRGGDRLWIGGVEDPATSRPDLSLATPRDPKAPLILMAHAPDYADDVVLHPDGRKVDLILSGHTHGGQVRLPLVGALVLPEMGMKYVHGHFQLGATQLYVNRGLGTVSVPFRLNCAPEITTITLHPA